MEFILLLLRLCCYLFITVADLGGALGAKSTPSVQPQGIQKILCINTQIYWLRTYVAIPSEKLALMYHTSASFIVLATYYKHVRNI